jgi:hypothetical protein
MRSEEDLKENWPDFKPETLACLLADQNGSLSHRPRYTRPDGGKAKSQG